MTSIGPAVANGGITTFLALLLCCLSTGHVFLTFFKVFSLTVAFGLFHGLVLFPVLLSVLGPEDTSPASESSSPVTSHSSDVSSSARSSQTTSPDKGKRNKAFDPDVGSHIFVT